MLKNIFIQNYALIDHLELEFEKGLNIVTGETGAGKSILLGALSMILGSRADTTVLFDASRKCIVEGRFEVAERKLKDFFREHELDFENPLVIRREISIEGKSRSFINDTPVNLAQLKELSSLLIDIHSQHETLLLNKSGFQLSVVDAFAKHEKVVAEYKTLFFRLQSLSHELGILVEEEKKSKADFDYYRFLFNELADANLAMGEQEKLEEELQTLTHAEEIKSGIANVQSVLSIREENLVQQLGQVGTSLSTLAKYNSRIEELAVRMKSAVIELKDISNEIDLVSDEINYDPRRLEVIQERLDILYKLQQKHRVKTVEELVVLMKDFEVRLTGISSLETKIEELSEQITELKNSVVSMAYQISANRNKVIPVIEGEIKKRLVAVSLPNAVLKIENDVLGNDQVKADGIDQVRFLFSANKGVGYADISKVASGGELSRLMLCIKSSVASLIALPTIIFDEIDTGISGETAVHVGKVLKEMAGKHQLIAITHLPQIAGRGEAHYFVFKEVIGKKTFTKVRKLNPDERIVEIAKMLSGEKPSAVAIENAKELLRN